ncbi:type II secretion system F family protein [bacterium]|nr:type II secretion system F family protein [bacterium]
MKYSIIILVFVSVYLATLGLQSGWRGRLLALMARLKARSMRSTSGLQPASSRTWDARRIYRWRLAGAVLMGLSVFFVIYASPASPAAYLLVLAAAAGGFLLPLLILKIRQAARFRALESQLSDALELIANSLRAGLSLVQALEVVAQEALCPVSEEFGEVVRDCRLGLSPLEALEKMLKRWDNKDLELFVVAAGVSLRTGGNLAEVAGRQIETIRERSRLQGRIATLTAQGKMSGWVVGLLPLGLLIGLGVLDPELISGFCRHPLGMVMLGAGLVMEIIGAWVISRIVKIEV